MALLSAAALTPTFAHAVDPLGAGQAGASPPIVFDPLRGAASAHIPAFDVRAGDLRPSGNVPSTSGTPAWLAYNPGDSAFWIAVQPHGVDVVSESDLGNVSVTIPVGASPFGVVLDNATAEVFVTNTGSNNVSVLSTSELVPLDTIGVGFLPTGIAYDWRAGEIFVANRGSDNVSVISETTLRVVASIPVGADPVGIAYEESSDHVFVADHGSGDVRIIDPTLNRVVASLVTGLGPYGVAVDSTNDHVFVTNEGSNNLTDIDPTTDRAVASIPVMAPSNVDLQGLAYDDRTDEFWVGAGVQYLVIVNASADAVSAISTTDPSGVAFDPSSGTICTTSTLNSTFTCLTPTSRSQSGVAVTFTETGLPAGTPWSVNLLDGPAATSTGTQLAFRACGWNYPYGGLLCPSSDEFVIPTAADGYASNVSTVAVPLDTPSVNVSLAFSPGPPRFSVSFLSDGLPWQSAWSFHLNGTVEMVANTSIQLPLANGTYGFSLDPVLGFTPSVSAGSVTVSGVATSVSIGFDPDYNATFQEVGLPDGTQWGVNLTSGPGGFPLPAAASSTTALIGLALPDGAYVFEASSLNATYRAPSPSWFVMAESSTYPQDPVVVSFVLPVYAVVFNESGLPVGSPWSVTLNGTQQNSTASLMAFLEPSGTYAYSVAGPHGYLSAPVGGTVTVLGTAPPPISIRFSVVPPPSYSVVFSETGLPAQTEWSVFLNGTSGASNTTYLSFDVPNGTYAFQIPSVPGYSPVPRNGSVTVAGSAPPVQVVTFSAVPVPEYNVSFSESGLPADTAWAVLLGSQVSGGLRATIPISVPNGSYEFVVLPVIGFQSTPSGGQLVVSGEDLNVSVSFVPTPPVVGSESTGALSGTEWLELGLGVAALLAVGIAAGLILGLRGRRGGPPEGASAAPK